MFLSCQSTLCLVLKLVSKSVRKFRRAHLSYIFFGEFTYAIKPILQLLLIAFQFCVAGIGWDFDKFADAHQNAGERFRNYHPVPAIQHPGAIKGYVEALRDDPKIELPQRHRFLEIIETHTDRLNLIITDLLLLSKIESGQIPLKQESVELALLINRTLGLLSHQIDRKQHKIVLDIPARLPPVLGDEERLGQVFSNLLDNAVKYTPDKGTLTVTAVPNDTMIEVGIEDTGIGIPPKDLSRIFERFYRVDKARSRELGGTGLGLAIVKHLVEAHGGTVSVQSAGKGSRFTVRLPVVAHQRDH